MRKIDTAAADHIASIATDAENEAELRAESLDYQNEIRGFHDEDVEFDFGNDYPDDCWPDEDDCDWDE